MAYDIEIRKPKTKYSVMIGTDAFKKLINNSLGDPQSAKRFIAEMTTLVSNNPKLAECEPMTIYSACMTAQSLGLSTSPSLGLAHVIPYLNTKKDENGKFYKIYEATFQIGWKGLAQLALETGQYKDMGCREVCEGDIKGYNKHGEPIIEINPLSDREKVIGYVAWIELLNGYYKEVYWTKEQCEKHADTYSKSHQGKNKGGDNDKWSSDFENMALKTVFKQVINKWGIKSTKLETAIIADQSVVKGNGNYEYVDNQDAIELLPSGTNINNSLEELVINNDQADDAH